MRPDDLRSRLSARRREDDLALPRVAQSLRHDVPPPLSPRIGGVRNPSEKSERRPEIFDLLAGGHPPAFAIDSDSRVIFWNPGAEDILGKPSEDVLGRRCHDVVAFRDLYGNRYCHDDCSVVQMTRRNEPVHAYEATLPSSPGKTKTVSVTILQIPGAKRDTFTVLHVLQEIDEQGRLARALEQIGATRVGPECAAPSPAAAAEAILPKVASEPPLTNREREILRCIASGLQNKEVASKLTISLATVRNHVRNMLEKLGVHSKLEAVSLAFRNGWIPPTDPQKTN